METLTINRGEWLTGTARAYMNASVLRHPETTLKCCLGFYGEACGLMPTQLDNYIALTQLMHIENSPELAQAQWLRQWLDAKDTKRFPHCANVQDALIDTNDKQSGIHPTRREAAIKYLFKKYGGIEVNFVGRYAEATRKARAAKKQQ